MRKKEIKVIRFTSLTKATFLKYFGAEIGTEEDDRGMVIFTIDTTDNNLFILSDYDAMQGGKNIFEVDVKKWLDAEWDIKRLIKNR